MADKDKNRDGPRDEDAIPLRGASIDEEEGDSLVGRPQAAHAPQAIVSSITNSAPVSILAYCLSSISMTVVNKFVVSGSSWNLTFLYLAAQVSRQTNVPASLDRDAVRAAPP